MADQLPRGARGSIGALIPAAGRSMRMGRPKPLLPLGDTDFIGRILRSLALLGDDLETVVVIRRQDDERLDRRLRLAGPVLVALVDDTPGDMLRSLRAGARLIEGAAGALVWPVDVPVVKEQTVREILRAAQAQPHRVIIPTCGGRAGHPTYVPLALLEGGSPTAESRGLRGMIEGASLSPLRVAVEDPLSLCNINTPQDYQRLLEDLTAAD